MKHILIGLVLAAFIALPATAQTPRSAKESFDIQHKMQDTYDTRIIPNMGLKLSGMFSVWYLLGEPVINCTARWHNPTVLQVIMDDGSRVLSEPGETEMWNLMLMAQFPNTDKKARRLTNGGGAHLSIFCDAGVVAQSGHDGFNVAGSPAWDKFICATPNKVDPRYNAQVDRKAKDSCAAIGGDWLPAAEAKKVAIKGVKVNEVSVLSVELSAGGTQRRAEKMLWRKKSFENKYAKAQDLKARLSKKGLNKGIAAAQRIYTTTSGTGRYPTAAQLDEMNSLLDALRADLQGDVADFSADWRDRDQALVSAQLERVAKVDRNLRQRDAELAAYRARLTELAKNAPEGPQNPLEDYIVAEHTLEPFFKPYSSNQGLKNKSGRVVVEPKKGRYKPLIGKSGTKYDFYIGDMDNFTRTYWIVDKNGIRQGQEFYRGYPRFHEELGLISFASGDEHSNRAYLTVYSLAEKRVVFSSEQTPITDSYRNKRELRTRDRNGRSGTWHRDYGMDISRITLAGRAVIYGLAKGLYPYKFDKECNASTEKGDTEGVMPAFMYDLETSRLLRPEEHLCVPNPTVDWLN
jgi:hypothetical protein